MKEKHIIPLKAVINCESNVVAKVEIYQWDERKRLINLKKHSLDFVDVIEVFKSSRVVVPSSHTGKNRFLAIRTLKGRFVTIGYTLGGEVIRVISFRRARNEEKETFQNLHGGRA
jgi:uncharacterized DUF497 family protein